jgi:7,8-dihydro-6-hydroxymethylpterin dimethyltransferase
MEDKEHALYLREEIVTHEVQHDLDKLGIAKTAREEKKRARDTKAENDSKKVKNDAAYDARMAQLYREVVLKEKPAISNEGGFIPLGAITSAIAPANGNDAAKKIEIGEPVAGD